MAELDPLKPSQTAKLIVVRRDDDPEPEVVITVPGGFSRPIAYISKGTLRRYHLAASSQDALSDYLKFDEEGRVALGN